MGARRRPGAGGRGEGRVMSLRPSNRSAGAFIDNRVEPRLVRCAAGGWKIEALPTQASVHAAGTRLRRPSMPETAA
jgi:hypothetical protein